MRRSRGGSSAHICLVAACLAIATCDAVEGAAPTGTPAPAGLFKGGGDAAALLQWVRDQGGEVHVEVRAVCPGCMRGTLATKDIEAGELIASIPLATVTDLGPEEQSLPESAAAWIRRMHADPAYNTSFQPYLGTLPAADGVLSPEMWTPDMVAALQSPELARMVSDRVDGAQQWWRHTGFADGAPDDAGLSIRLALPAFRHAIACIATRMFGHPSEAHNRTRRTVLLPILDMANCADKGLAGPLDLGANGVVVHPARGEGSFTMVALRDIAKGEEVTNTYSHEYLHRPDLALLSYGFTPAREPPILSAVDLPEAFGDVQQPLQSYPRTPFSDPDYGNATGLWTTEAELRRLLRIQAGLPTTLQQDEELLAGAQQPGVAAVLRWRVSRKRALLAAIAQLSASLAARHQAWPCNRNYGPAVWLSHADGMCNNTSAAGLHEQEDRAPWQQHTALRRQST